MGELELGGEPIAVAGGDRAAESGKPCCTVNAALGMSARGSAMSSRLGWRVQKRRLRIGEMGECMGDCIGDESRFIGGDECVGACGASACGASGADRRWLATGIVASSSRCRLARLSGCGGSIRLSIWCAVNHGLDGGDSAVSQVAMGFGGRLMVRGETGCSSASPSSARSSSMLIAPQRRAPTLTTASDGLRLSPLQAIHVCTPCGWHLCRRPTRSSPHLPTPRVPATHGGMNVCC
eukprot:4591100-Prymnesium_polylepis.1